MLSFSQLTNALSLINNVKQFKGSSGYLNIYICYDEKKTTVNTVVNNNLISFVNRKIILIKFESLL